jgi:hypothetical protein
MNQLRFLFKNQVPKKEKKNSNIKKTWQRTGIVAAAAGVIEGSKLTTEDKYATMLRAFKLQMKDIYEENKDSIPTSITLETLYTSDGKGSPFTGKQLWETWERVNREVMSKFIPEWKKGLNNGRFPSGKQLDDVLYEFRERLWRNERKLAEKSTVVIDNADNVVPPPSPPSASTASSSSPAAITAALTQQITLTTPRRGGSNTAVAPASSSDDDEPEASLPPDWFPADWLAFVLFGPPAITLKLHCKMRKH